VDEWRAQNALGFERLSSGKILPTGKRVKTGRTVPRTDDKGAQLSQGGIRVEECGAREWRVVHIHGTRRVRLNEVLRGPFPTYQLLIFVLFGEAANSYAANRKSHRSRSRKEPLIHCIQSRWGRRSWRHFHRSSRPSSMSATSIRGEDLKPHDSVSVGIESGSAWY